MQCESIPPRKPIVYGSVCSGIEAATAAWHKLGWQPAFFSEIDAFPRAVLAHHYPSVPLHGDFTTIQEHDYAAIDLLVGGTPCQAFSVAGLRKGFADQRGNLTLEFIRLAQRLRPRWLVWENVPGVLSIDRGRAFGSFLGGLAECGYGFAYRVLDAQHFGVPQRRRRVFVVGYLGDWRPAAAVLFEPESLFGDLTPSREARERASWDVAPSLTSSGRGVERTGESRGQDPVIAVCHALNAGSMKRHDPTSETLVTHSLRADGFDASEDGTGRGTPLVPVPHVEVLPTMRASASQDGPGHAARSGDTKDEYIVPMTLAIRGRESESRLEVRQDGLANAILTPNGGRAGIGCGAVAFAQNTRDELRYIGGDGQTVGALAAEPGMKQQSYIQQAMAVRRLTPRECERLQGFPDDYTLILYRGKPAADGPRYKALGNSMAVPVMRWIGERIQLISDMSLAA